MRNQSLLGHTITKKPENKSSTLEQKKAKVAKTIALIQDESGNSIDEQKWVAMEQSKITICYVKGPEKKSD